MVEFDAFRQDLATALLHCAERRRLSCAGGTATGEEIKTIALLERLANDVENLDLHVFLIFELMFTDKRIARRFLRQREDLLAQVGVLYCPSRASELVQWLAKQTGGDRRDDRAPHSRSPARVYPPRQFRRRSASRPALLNTRAQRPGRSWTSEFSAGIGIVAPLLSLWHVRLAFGQLHDRSFAAAHATVPATVVSVDPVGAGKSASLANTVVLAFQPASGATCHVRWRAVSPTFAVAPGETLPVVPRSSVCEMPVIPAELGDPMQSLGMAAALMTAGLASITLWTWLFRHVPRPRSRLFWSSPRERRHDLA